MRHFHVLDISFYQIQIFLAVGERESITQAAQYLNITQSAVSKNIKSLEDTLGLYLFRREKQALCLTPAGRLLMDEMSTIYTMTENALEKAHVLQKGEEKPIVIGLPDSSNLERFFLNTKDYLRKHNISTSLHIECLPFHQLEKQLQNGVIDIVLTCGFDLVSFEHPELTCITLPSGPYYAYMKPENTLSERGSIPMSELQSHPFLMFSPIETPAYEQLVLSMCRSAGFQPQIAKYVTSPNSFICNFETGQEVFIADAYMRESDNTSLRRVAIRESQSCIALIRRRRNSNLTIPYIFSEIAACWEEAGPN
ncbi:LysR family transcriptional regulator [Ruminococcus gauvreauii]|uniref:LysR family transcriptional regulator n=1 Tax=Ruminococcus gauvreauii TaxID=438033 RepID=A0ABY5VLF5_9FIRM|nr:LysR family transcriptional regulator [Ruminococcus gauvreauii]UWP60988.1 LysR family transcriptional regulator [Ruminococcus gauvreauii]